MKKMNYLVNVLKGILVAVGITVIGIALLALFAKGGAEDTTVSVISFIVKILSVIAGTVISASKIMRRGAATGAVVGLTYWLVCLALSVLLGTPAFSFEMFGDIAFTVMIGAFAGILTVNVLK